MKDSMKMLAVSICREFVVFWLTQLDFFVGATGSTVPSDFFSHDGSMKMVLYLPTFAGSAG